MMARSLEQALASLSAMSPTELRRQWLQLYKTPAPPLTADLLARGAAWRMQEKVAGDFSPATLRLVARLAKQLERDITGVHWSGPRFFGVGKAA